MRPQAISTPSFSSFSRGQVDVNLEQNGTIKTGCAPRGTRTLQTYSTFCGGRVGVICIAALLKLDVAASPSWAKYFHAGLPCTRTWHSARGGLDWFEPQSLQGFCPYSAIFRLLRRISSQRTKMTAFQQTRCVTVSALVPCHAHLSHKLTANHHEVLYGGCETQHNNSSNLTAPNLQPQASHKIAALSYLPSSRLQHSCSPQTPHNPRSHCFCRPAGRYKPEVKGVPVDGDKTYCRPILPRSRLLQNTLNCRRGQSLHKMSLGGEVKQRQ